MALLSPLPTPDLGDHTVGLRPTVAVVDLAALRSNLDYVRRLIGPRRGIIAVVKADGYGHGMIPIAREAVRWGVAALGVGTADEALELRNSEGLGEVPIIVMGPTLPDDAELLQDAGVRIAVGTLDSLKANLRAARRRGAPAHLHLKIDTGMGRNGFAPDDPHWFEAVRRNGEDIEGIFTHFAVSESRDLEAMAFTNEQRERFEAAVRRVHRLGLRPVHHAANSGAILNHPQTHFELVRPGLLLYGAEPSGEYLSGAPLKPVLRLQSRLLAIYQRRAGETISYGRTWRLDRDSPIGVIPVGYGDGYPRSLSNRADVLIHGRRAPIVGTVCMDQLLVDLSGIPEARPGDDVILYGAQGRHSITLEETAGLAGTIPYELTCQLTRRVPRVYVDSEKP